VTTEGFIWCFGYVAKKTSSSPPHRHVGHYLVYIDSKYEMSILLADVHAAMMSIPLVEGFSQSDGDTQYKSCWIKSQGINKLRMIQLLEADLNQVIRSVFTRNISKLAQETPDIINKHQYGQSHETCLTLVLQKLLTVKLLIQKKTNDIVFGNDAKGCYGRIISGIALAALRKIG
jgi:hypothetical protein